MSIFAKAKDWLRPKTPIVTPVTSPNMPAPLAAFIEQLQRQGMQALVVDGRGSAGSAGITRPPPPAAEPTAPGLTWGDWTSTMKLLGTRPGWSPCRIAVQTFAGNCLWLHGVTYRSFSVHSSPFSYCEFDSDEVEATSGEKPFAVVSHLFNGGQLGIFADRDTAMDCVELAERLVEWHGVYDDPTIARLADQTHRAWHASGLQISTTMHVHVQGSIEPVFVMAPPPALKPEVLS